MYLLINLLIRSNMLGLLPKVNLRNFIAMEHISCQDLTNFYTCWKFLAGCGMENGLSENWFSITYSFDFVDFTSLRISVKVCHGRLFWCLKNLTMRNSILYNVSSFISSWMHYA